MTQYQPIHRPTPTDDKAPTPPPRLALYMPATPPLGLIYALELWWWRYRRRRQFRQRFLPLLAHDDHILEDMGHQRDDIQWASRLPLKEDAHKALTERRARHKR
ncbi:hypothetical protein [Franzmannia qiaohouensis]|uniref:DUF1127 domain-containing protein n=1 Tax=Franzmannia qiaohouensis TaxID=1329370 RepID=A0ABU1HDQ0_9GAMM|nr:hypothetical protein [Halomonas qiaohouensis]MDR5905598.1 hypothetical protein [Halomonas qiaohouensis]